LIARADLALVDPLSVHHRARLVAEIDERDVPRTGDLDDRVHAAREIVVDTQMAPRVLSDLHDVLRDRVAAHELVALIESERQCNLGLTFHRRSTFPYCES
jgi:hypothetical protein